MKTKLLIFGITGDLSTRKLLPAIKRIVATNAYDDLEIIGVSRREVNVDELLTSSLGDTALAGRLSVFSMDLAKASDYERLRESLALADDEQLLVYLSVPPRAAAQIVDFLGDAGITTPNVKLLFEKPFGVDLNSAQEVIERTARHYNESQLYRIDHYLAKEMAQNIAALRGGNALLSHVWSNESIESIEVLALEKITIEGRAQFYEQVGALRDVVQGHLMQLLALILMDIPGEFAWEKLPQARLAALQQLQPANPETTVRAQYAGYQEEAQNIGSLTETFVSLKLQSTDPRWKDVPLVLTTGKAMDKKTTEIRINFRKFHEAQSNCLIFRIQPNEGVEIDLNTKKPGYEREFETRKLAFTYPEDITLPDAYEHVIIDAIRDRKSLFTSSEEVLVSWRILQPLLDAWAMDNAPLKKYPVHTLVDTLLSQP
ncbi:MAG TPA: glucose-6-phosphate dehydrogenase [Candidatus Saccharimonadales bacterium]|nr:glucose-6-phosphate dehydrogenase [Candidatus Saccharimonadales bacterium]